MDYRLREHATKVSALQAQTLSELGGMIEKLDASAEVGKAQLEKLQHEYVNLHNRFLRLIYLSGEITSE